MVEHANVWGRCVREHYDEAMQCLERDVAPLIFSAAKLSKNVCCLKNSEHKNRQRDAEAPCVQPEERPCSTHVRGGTCRSVLDRQ